MPEPAKHPEPKISVLIPTRGRPKELIRCLDNLRDTAANPDDIECLFRIDQDDTGTVSLMPTLVRRHPNNMVLTGHQYQGWKSNHVFYNELAATARGEWLFLYNDDARIETFGWDTEILNAPKQRLLATRMFRGDETKPHRYAAPSNKQKTHELGNAFPIMHRDIYNTLGHFAAHNHADVYVEWLIMPLGLQHNVSIDIRHTPHASQEGKGYWRAFTENGPFKKRLAANAAKLKQRFGK